MSQLTIILIRIRLAELLGFAEPRQGIGIAMYICLCHGITDRQIRRVVDEGASSLGEVQLQLPVGGCCGRCEPAARELIREHASQTVGSEDAALA